MIIEGANNPKNGATVTERGQISSVAISETEQQDSASNGRAYNINTDDIILTDDAETPIFYLKNESELKDIKVSRVFKSFGESAGGVGEFSGGIYFNITGGTILSATELTPENFNAGSFRDLGADCRIGATGLTFSGGRKPIKFLFPSQGQRILTAFDHIVLPRGSSMLFTITPPAGNTSFRVQAGCNVFVKEIDV